MTLKSKNEEINQLKDEVLSLKMDVTDNKKIIHKLQMDNDNDCKSDEKVTKLLKKIRKLETKSVNQSRSRVATCLSSNGKSISDLDEAIKQTFKTHNALIKAWSNNYYALKGMTSNKYNHIRKLLYMKQEELNDLQQKLIEQAKLIGNDDLILFNKYERLKEHYDELEQNQNILNERYDEKCIELRQAHKEKEKYLQKLRDALTNSLKQNDNNNHIRKKRSNTNNGNIGGRKRKLNTNTSRTNDTNGIKDENGNFTKKLRR